MKKNNLVWLLIGTVMALVLACGGGESTTTKAAATKVPTKTAETTSTAATSSATTEDLTIVMQEVPGMAYVPANITMNAGQTYNVKLVGGGEFHTWTIVDSSGAYVENLSINPDMEDIIQVTAPASGTYDILCLPHQTNGMVGTLVVN
jgi:plastocyanin